MAAINLIGPVTNDLTEFSAQSGSPAHSTSNGGQAAQSVRINPTAATQTVNVQRFDGNGNSIALGAGSGVERFYTFYIYVASFPAADTIIAEIENTSSLNFVVKVVMTSAGVLTLVGSTTSASFGTISLNTRHRIQVRATANATSGASLDGGTEETCTATNNTQNWLRLGNVGSATWDAYYSDIHIDDAGFPGAGSVFPMTVTGAGSQTTGWSTGTGTAFTEVDDWPKDDDTTYIATSTSGDARTYTLSDPASLGSTISAIKAMGHMRDEGGGSAITLRIRSSGSNSDSSAMNHGTSYVFRCKVATVDPATGSAWTQSGVNGAEVGVASSANVAQRCTNLMAAVWATIETGASGTGAITLPFIDVAGVGDHSPAAATSGITLPFLSVGGTGAQVVPASGAITLPFIALAGAGAESFAGAGAVSLPFLTVAGAGLLTDDSAVGGESLFLVYNPSGTLIISIRPLWWETHRYLNRVGSWEGAIPAAAPLVNGVPLGELIERGWRISIVQEGTHPLFRPDLEYLMYQGMVEDKRYSVDESGQAVLELSGMFRAAELIARVTPTSVQYEGATILSIAEDIVDSLAGGITAPASAGTRTMTVRFNSDEGGHVLGRYHRLLRVGEYGRYALRESWEGDALEFVSLDGAPSSGYTMVNAEQASNGEPGRDIALVGGTPTFRREGHAIVNRVLAYGKDIYYKPDENAETIVNLAGFRYGTPIVDQDDQGEAMVTEQRPLTLEFASLSSPYTVQSGTNPNVRAASVITIKATPTAGDTLTIAGTTYTFVASGANDPGEINVGDSPSDAKNNLKAALEGTDGWNTENTAVTISPFKNSVADITAVAFDTPIASSWSFTSPENTLDPFDYPPGLSEYWYIEDADSIARHGLVEMPMHRSDVVNPDPEEGSATRIAAANVLYQLAQLELQKHRFPKIFVEVPVANGANVWALPGDTINLQYSGVVTI